MSTAQTKSATPMGMSSQQKPRLVFAREDSRFSNHDRVSFPASSDFHTAELGRQATFVGTSSLSAG